MKKRNQYKNFLKLSSIFYLKTRFLKFRRTKWFYLKKTLAKFFINKFALKFFKQKDSEVVSLQLSFYRSLFKKSLIMKRRFFNFFCFFKKAKKIKKLFLKSHPNFLLTLESQLDTILWRAGFFQSPAIARFYISHKNFFVNNEIVTIPKLIIKAGDIITMTKALHQDLFIKKKRSLFKSKKIFWLINKPFNYIIPFYLETNWDTGTIFFLFDLNQIKMDRIFLSTLYHIDLDPKLLRFYFNRL